MGSASCRSENRIQGPSSRAHVAAVDAQQGTCSEKPRPFSSAEDRRPDCHFPLLSFLASIRSMPSETVKGNPNTGSANCASPKSPCHGVCAVQRVLGPQGDTLSLSSKSSRKTIE